MRFKDKITPGFLLKIDKYLLLNYPHVWATQIHQLVFWMTPLVIMMAIWAFCTPVYTYDVPVVIESVFFTMIPMGIIFLYWSYQMSLYNAETQFGRISTRIQHFRLLIGLGGIFLLMIGPFVYAVVLNQRIAAIATHAEIVEDINTINTSILYQHKLKISPEDSGQIADIISLYIPETSNDDYPQIQPLTYEALEANAEKIVQNSVGSTDLMQRAMGVKDKYYRPYSSFYTETYDPMDLNTYEVSRNMERILLAKERSIFKRGDKEVPILWVLFLAWLGLMLTVFLRTGLRIFTISAISGFALSLAAVFVSELAQYDIRFDTLRVLYFIAWLIAVGLTFSGRNTTKFNLVRKVALSLIVAFSPLVFFMFFGLTGNWESLTGIMAGVGATYLGWFVLLNRRMNFYIAQPKDE